MSLAFVAPVATHIFGVSYAAGDSVDVSGWPDRGVQQALRQGWITVAPSGGSTPVGSGASSTGNSSFTGGGSSNINGPFSDPGVAGVSIVDGLLTLDVGTYLVTVTVRATLSDVGTINAILVNGVGGSTDTASGEAGSSVYACVTDLFVVTADTAPGTVGVQVNPSIDVTSCCVFTALIVKLS